jgi:hypothetical protein
VRAVRYLTLAGLGVCTVAGSRFLARGLSEQLGWALPARTYIAPLLLPGGSDEAVDARESGVTKPTGVEELVFVGTLEFRKGLHVFCEAVGRVLRDAPATAARLKVTGLSDPFSAKDPTGQGGGLCCTAE